MASLDNPFFYNSVNGDRVYDADSFEYLLKKFFTTGVFTGDCAVSATSGMGVQMAAGYCNIDGKVKFYPNPVSLTLATANPTYDRIDTVVIERNDTDRAFHVKAVTGSASATPAATAPVRSAGIYQIVLAEVYVAAGAVSITQANITDKRPDSSVCGLVCSAAQTPDFSDLYSQFTDAFGVWFDRMKGQLSTDAAGNLQNQIDAIHNVKSVTNKFSNKSSSIGEVRWRNSPGRTGNMVCLRLGITPNSVVGDGAPITCTLTVSDDALIPYIKQIGGCESGNAKRVTVEGSGNDTILISAVADGRLTTADEIILLCTYMCKG